MTLRAAVFCWVVLLLIWLPAQSQSVISAQSGLIHFSEGTVSLDGSPVVQTFGKFVQMKSGSELMTRDGRAEVMLTPGVYLRLGEESSVRMLSNSLADTRMEFLSGAAIVDSANGSANAPITILCQGYQVQLHGLGRYRFDSMPAKLQVESGEAHVLQDGKSTVVAVQSVFSFGSGQTEQGLFEEPGDALGYWNRARTDSISQSNKEAGKATDLSAAMDSWRSDPDAVLRALRMSGYMPLRLYPNYRSSTLNGPGYLDSSRLRGPGYLGSGPYRYRGSGSGGTPIGPAMHRGPGGWKGHDFSR
jgi:hypothetical protein